MNEELVPLVGQLKKQVLQAVSELRSDPKMKQILGLHAGLIALEDTCGLPKTSLAELFDLQEKVQVRPTEFYGLEPLDAAKKYLYKKGADGAAFPEIVIAIRSGGCELRPSEEPTLRTSLSRSTLDVAKISDDLYGLLEFFPHVKRGGRKKKPDDVIEEAIASVVNGTPEKDAVE